MKPIFHTTLAFLLLFPQGSRVLADETNGIVENYEDDDRVEKNNLYVDLDLVWQLREEANSPAAFTSGRATYTFHQNAFFFGRLYRFPIQREKDVVWETMSPKKAFSTDDSVQAESSQRMDKIVVTCGQPRITKMAENEFFVWSRVPDDLKFTAQFSCNENYRFFLRCQNNIPGSSPGEDAMDPGGASGGHNLIHGITVPDIPYDEVLKRPVTFPINETHPWNSPDPLGGTRSGVVSVTGSATFSTELEGGPCNPWIGLKEGTHYRFIDIPGPVAPGVTVFVDDPDLNRAFMFFDEPLWARLSQYAKNSVVAHERKHVKQYNRGEAHNPLPVDASTEDILRALEEYRRNEFWAYNAQFDYINMCVPRAEMKHDYYLLAIMDLVYDGKKEKLRTIDEFWKKYLEGTVR